MRAVLTWTLCALFSALGVCFAPSSASAGSTVLPLSSVSSSLSVSSASSLQETPTPTPEPPPVPTPTPTGPTGSPDPSPDPSSPSSPPVTSEPTEPPPSSAGPFSGPESSSLVDGSCGTADVPCVTESTLAERSVFLAGLGLLVMLSAATLVTLWGRD